METVRCDLETMVVSVEVLSGVRRLRRRTSGGLFLSASWRLSLADVGADREEIIKQLRAISPKGKMPLAKPVEHAAQATVQAPGLFKIRYVAGLQHQVLARGRLTVIEQRPCGSALRSDQVERPRVQTSIRGRS